MTFTYPCESEVEYENFIVPRLTRAFVDEWEFVDFVREQVPAPAWWNKNRKKWVITGVEVRLP